ncbi:hypothetical protein CLOM_g9580 [Closterium sp. NIES-68]|nr:hypothetical protein CLOM_g21029 [Closterium sp. NIES-68]GJP50442.1 hypothetical protein CLOM_g9580 [Closterium sp. NIES-68]GJP74530.1 hypothetical protein CLOP_g5094 [Closterium sp. NIES-67]
MAPSALLPAPTCTSRLLPGLPSPALPSSRHVHQSAIPARQFSRTTLSSAPASWSVVRAVGGGGGAGGPETFLSLEEAGLVELAGLDTHERFLARLTISSLNLLRVVSEQEGVPIEELNAGRVCDWFLKDKAKREEDIDSAVLKWPKAPEW